MRDFPQVPGYSWLWDLGAGPSGSVFACRHDASGARLALKFFHPGRWSDPAFAARFCGQASAWQELDDPRAVRFYECFGTGQSAVAVMELIRGHSLSDLLAIGGPLEVTAALGLADEILLGLAAAHEIGLVHGNLKPPNVLLGPSGEVKLTDFSVLPPAGPGTAGAPYQAPEQRDGAPASPASDVYAAAAIVLRCVSGNEVPASNGPDVPGLEQVAGPLRSLILHGLAWDPQQRPRSAAGYLGELRDSARRACGDNWRAEGARVLSDWASRQAVAGPHAGSRHEGLGPPRGSRWQRIVRGGRAGRRTLAAGLAALALATGTVVFVVAGHGLSAANARHGTGGTDARVPARPTVSGVPSGVTGAPAPVPGNPVPAAYSLPVISAIMARGDLTLLQPGKPALPGGFHAFSGICTGSADGHCGAIVFFNGNTPVGIMQADPSAARIAWDQAPEIIIDFSVFKTGDPLCCPSGGMVVGHYRLTGSGVVAVGATAAKVPPALRVAPGEPLSKVFHP